MDFHSLKAFTEEWAKQAGMSDVMHRGAELLSGSAAKRMANSVKLHGEAAKSLAAKGSTTANLHREAGGIAAKRLATEAEKVTQARIGAGAGLAGGAYGVHKATEEDVYKRQAIPLSFAPTQARLRGAAPLPAPAPLPKIDAVQVGNNFAMHRPTVLAHLERPAPASTAAKTIPAPAASLPRAGGILGAAERATIHAPSSFPASVAKTCLLYTSPRAR